MSLEFYGAQLDTEILIKEIKARPCLYSKENLKYNDVLYKRAEWERVAKALFPDFWDAYEGKEKDDKVELVQRRWRNVRACFVRELKRQKDPKWIYGVAYKRRKYLYFEQLSFLTNECDVIDEDTKNDIDLPEKIEVDNTTVTINTNIEEMPLPEVINVGAVTYFLKSKDTASTKPSTNPYKTILSSNSEKNILSSNSVKNILSSNSEKNILSSNSEKNILSSNSEKNILSSSSDDEKPLVKSDTTESFDDSASTNFALSLVPMLNLIPMHERVDAQIQILSVLKQFMNKVRDDGKDPEEVGRKRKEYNMPLETYGKKKDIKDEDSEEDSKIEIVIDCSG